MFYDDEEPKDWEIEDQDPPEQLKRKWIVEDLKPQDPIVCPSCKKTIPYDSVFCLFCGSSVYSRREYFFQKLLSWFKKFISGRKY